MFGVRTERANVDWVVTHATREEFGGGGKFGGIEFADHELSNGSGN
jgi:hypothetical protein